MAFFGAGSIVPAHLEALDRLRRTDLVGVMSRTATRAAATTAGRRVSIYTDMAQLLDDQQFASGATGSFVNTRLIAPPVIELELVSADRRTTIRLATEREDLGWDVTFTEPAGVASLTNKRGTYEVESEAFLDAVEAGAPDSVLATYRDALATDRLTRSVVAMAGVAG